MSNKSSFSSGCLSIIARLFVAFIITGIVIFKFDLRLNSLLIFAFSFIISDKIFGFFEKSSKPKSSTIITLVLIFVVYVGFKFLVNDFRFETSEDDSVAENSSTKTIKINRKDSIQVFAHKRKWKDYLGNKFDAELLVPVNEYQKAQRFHRSLNYRLTHNSVFKNIYKDLVEFEQPNLKLVLQTFKNIQQTHNLNKREFAEMIVSCIQDIKYSLIFQRSCEEVIKTNSEFKKIYRECKSCCVGYKKYGLNTPTEFLATLKGDCDTRTVLLFFILDKFGYDVAILNSDFYKHSVLGINLPASGLYKNYKGKKYYLWETTNKYFEIGNLTTYNDTRKWYFVLTNN